MSRRPFNPYDEYPLYPGEGHHQTDDMTDEAQILGLGPRLGDTDASHKTLNHPWGKVVHLVPFASVNGTLRTVAAVQTEVAPRPFPWAIQARFSRDGITYTPTIPASWTGQLAIDIIKSFDVKTGPMRERFILDPGDGLPVCALISRSLTVNVSLLGENALELWVALVVCPTTQIDCAELRGPAAEIPIGYTDLGIARFPAQTATPTIYIAHPRRAMFTIVNMSAANLFVALSGIVNITPGTEVASIVLPGNASAAYSVINFRGTISFRFDADDATGYALVSEGRYSL